MKLIGKVIGATLKDVGKGKDAQAHEVLVLNVKLDGVDGIRGRVEFVPGDNPIEIGDVVSVDITVKQGKLALQK